MDEVLHFFRTYETWIYIVIGIGTVIYLRRFLLAWQELRSTIFGLEREQAQNRLNRAAGVLTFLIIMVLAEFVLVSYVAPLRPEANPLLTPTIDLLATATATLAPTLEGGEAMEAGPTLTPSPTFDARLGTCVAGEIEITSPEPGQRVSDEVDILGSADIPNFGFYKLEIAQVQSVTWRTIQARREVVNAGVLVSSWDTATLQAGDYLLRLVVIDNEGNSLPDCRVPITILPPEE